MRVLASEARTEIAARVRMRNHDGPVVANVDVTLLRGVKACIFLWPIFISPTARRTRVALSVLMGLMLRNTCAVKRQTEDSQESCLSWVAIYG